MVLREDREDAIEETKLRAVGLTKPSVRERLGPKVNEYRETRRGSPPPKHGPKYDGRTCHICKVKGHIARDYPESDGKRLNSTKEKTGEGKRTSETGGEPTNDRAKKSIARRGRTERATGNNGGRGRSDSGRGGRKPKARWALGRHTTAGATCGHYGIANHTEDQCWSKNATLNPFAGRRASKQLVTMALLNAQNKETDKQWKA